MGEPIKRRVPGNINCVLIDLIELSESFDQINRVSLITGKLISDGMRVDCDMHDPVTADLYSSLAEDSLFASGADFPPAAAASAITSVWRVSRSRMRAAFPRSPRR